MWRHVHRVKNPLYGRRPSWTEFDIECSLLPCVKWQEVIRMHVPLQCLALPLSQVFTWTSSTMGHAFCFVEVYKSQGVSAHFFQKLNISQALPNPRQVQSAWIPRRAQCLSCLSWILNSHLHFGFRLRKELRTSWKAAGHKPQFGLNSLWNRCSVRNASTHTSYKLSLRSWPSCVSHTGQISINH